jgi:integrase
MTTIDYYFGGFVLYYNRRSYRCTYRMRHTPFGPKTAYDIQPIRDPAKIIEIQRHIVAQGGNHADRNLFMFQLGINSGLRVSDLLWLTVRDVRHGEHMVTRELKTGKLRRFFINDKLRKVIDRYIAGMDDDDYLFASQRFPRLPIDRHHAYRILRYAGDAAGVYDIGTHSLRKTFGYHHYARYRDIVTLMLIFNHSSQEQTLDYIGWTQRIVDESLADFFLGEL